MSVATDAAKLAQLVEDLYAKKRWLDRVIASLEAAISSPDYKLIAALSETFENGRSGANVDLLELQQSRLEQLASAVSRRRNGKAKRIAGRSDAASAS